jgi:hypothetical protein
MLRKVVIVAPEFPPCNLTAAHRSRLFVRHLPEFGYEPIVLTVRPECYEGTTDTELEQLLPEGLQIVRTKALTTRPVRLVGDLGIRSFWFHFRKLKDITAAWPVDLVFLPIPPNYSCLLGPLIKRRRGIPYVIDYIDPWVYPITPEERRSWKARLSHWLARQLEPIAARHADGLTAVADSYYEGVLQRHPELQRLPRAAMPYGAEPLDFEYVRRTQRRSRVLDSLGLKDKCVFVYAGAALPRATETYRVLFRGLHRLQQNQPQLGNRIHMLFVGTAAGARDPAVGPIAPLAQEIGVADSVTELPRREPYLEILSLLTLAHAVMVLGSSETHYTPSKLYQALQAERPLLGVLHEQCPAGEVLNKIPDCEWVPYGADPNAGEDVVERVERALRRLAQRDPSQRVIHNESVMDGVSAREMTRRLAECFDRVLANQPSARATR